MKHSFFNLISISSLKIIYFIILFHQFLKIAFNKQLIEYDFGCIKLFANSDYSNIIEKMSLGSNNQTKLRKFVVIKKKGYGYISSSGYPKDGFNRVKCAVNLEAPKESGLVLQINFLDLDLEPKYSRSDQCLRDYIILTFIDREGLEHSSERICGNKKPQSVQTMQSKLRVLFIATSPPLKHYLTNLNNTKKWKGFKLRFDFVKEETIPVLTSYFDDPNNKRYKSECGGSNLPNTLSEIIQSPGYPSTYPRNIKCFWLIRVNPNKRIYIKIIDLELSPTLADYERAVLSIIDGYSFEIYFEEKLLKMREQTNEILNFGSPKRNLNSLTFFGNKSYYTEEGSLSYLSESNRVIIEFITRDGPTQNQLNDYKINFNPIGFRLHWTEVISLITTSSDFPLLNTDSETTLVNQNDKKVNIISNDLCPGFICLGGSFCLDNQNSVCVDRNRLCINETLRCDGISNCAENDDSDEQYCYSKNPFSLLALTLLIIILIIFLLLISTCCIIKSFGISKNENNQLNNREEYPNLEILNKEKIIKENKNNNIKNYNKNYNKEIIPTISSSIIQTNIIPATPPIIQEWKQINNNNNWNIATKNILINQNNESKQEIISLQPCLCPKPFQFNNNNEQNTEMPKIEILENNNNYKENNKFKWNNEEEQNIWKQRKSFIKEEMVNEDENI